MTAKEYLLQVKDMNMVINSKIRELKGLKNDIESLKSPIPCEKIKTSRSSDTSQKMIEKIIDMQRLINDEIDTFVNLKFEVREKISCLADNRYASILTDYYINGLSFEKIAENTHYSVKQTHRLHRLALEKFKEMHKMS